MCEHTSNRKVIHICTQFKVFGNPKGIQLNENIQGLLTCFSYPLSTMCKLNNSSMCSGYLQSSRSPWNCLCKDSRSVSLSLFRFCQSTSICYWMCHISSFWLESDAKKSGLSSSRHDAFHFWVWQDVISMSAMSGSLSFSLSLSLTRSLTSIVCASKHNEWWTFKGKFFIPLRRET